MRENNRKPIEKCRRKLSQFTTMNVIDGQAGLVIYSSLIFYSLTIDNILNIIVLLILAGVSIAMLTGNNGILTQANQAKENTKIATAKEKVQIEAAGSLDNTGVFSKAKFKENLKENLKLTDSDIVDNADGTMTVKIDGYDVTVDGTTGKVTGIAISNGKAPSTGVTPGTIVSKTEKNNYSDGTDTATIPEGFTVDKTENTISKGLVVHGPDGSEFVWVPVPNINSMSQCSTAGGNCNLQLEDGVLKCKTHNSTDIVGKLYATELGEKFGTENKTYSADSGLREPAIVKNSDNDPSFNTIGLTLSNMQENYKNMVTSVAKYGGFYVGRYETSLTSATNESAGTTGTVQSKQGVIPTGSGNSATSMWYGLYKAQNKTYTGTNNSVESSMIWGSQYDRILNWAKEGKNEEEKSKITKTSLGNNSGGIVTTTGNSKYSNDSINNIRDLGGNLFEWTLEADYTNYRVRRGGNYGTSISPSYRSIDSPNDTYSDYGSRLTLYIK